MEIVNDNQAETFFIDVDEAFDQLFILVEFSEEWPWSCPLAIFYFELWSRLWIVDLALDRLPVSAKLDRLLHLFVFPDDIPDSAGDVLNLFQDFFRGSRPSLFNVLL